MESSEKKTGVLVLDHKVLIIAVLIAACAALVWWGLVQNKAASDAGGVVKQQRDELMKKDLAIGKAETQFGDAQAQLKNLSVEWQQWIKEHGGSVEDVAFWQAKYEASMSGQGQKIQITVPGSPGTATGSTTIINNGGGASTPDSLSGVQTVDYVDSLGKVVWLDTNGDGKPDVKTSRIVLTYKDYRIDVTVDALKNYFEYSLHQNFKGEYVKVIEPKTGAVANFLKIYEIDDKGNTIKEMNLTDFKVITKAPVGDKSYYFWKNPKIDAGVNFNVSSRLQSNTSPEFGLSLSTKGKTKKDSEWRFFRFSAAQNKDKMIYNFSPACYNIGNKLPLINNTYICPTIGKSDGNTIGGFSINATF